MIWNVCVALMCLLGVGAAQAQTVVRDPNDFTKAIGIDNLVVDGTTYNVDFTDRTNPQNVYGDFPGVLDFDSDSLAMAAMDAVDAALNGAGIATVAAEGETGQDSYIVGFDTETVISVDNLVHLTSTRDVSWQTIGKQDLMPWRSLFPATKVFATFEEAGGPPPPTIDFTASPATIQFGEFSTLSWSVQDATSCTGSLGSGGWPGDKDPVSGSEDVSPVLTSPYLLTCAGAGGQSESELTVTVPEPDATLLMAVAMSALGVVGRSRGKRARGRPSQLD